MDRIDPRMRVPTMHDEIEELRTTLEQAEGGREFWKGSHQKVSQTLEQVKRERDEARGLLREAWDYVPLDQSGLNGRINAHLLSEGD